MTLNTVLYENSRPTGIGILEVVDSDGKGQLFVPLKKSHLSGEFRGPLGSLILIQEFGFSRKDLDRTIEAIYRFPLPGDASVKKVTAHIGDQVIETFLKEREYAKEEYNRAFEEGKSAALLTRESPDVFTLMLTGIPPDTDVRVITEFILLAKPEGKGWSMRMPLTIGPRFVRQDEDHPGIHAQPLLPSLDPHHRFSLELALFPAGPVKSPSHTLESTEEGDRTTIRLKVGSVIPDRDLLLSWTAKTSIRDCHITTWIENDDDPDEEFFITLISPPEMPAISSIPREIILILDCSGSMDGVKWQTVQKTVMSFLDTLRSEDTFNVCLFNHQTLWYDATGPVDAMPGHIERAKRFISRTEADGSTNLGRALEQGLTDPKDNSIRSRHILVFTDGQVSDNARILRLVESESEKEDRRRVSVVCIDTAPNSYLVTEIARLGGGIARFISTGEDATDIREFLKNLLISWQQPVYVNARLHVNRPWVEAFERTGHQSGNNSSSIDAGDIRAGSPVFIAGRIPKDSDDPVFTFCTETGEQIAQSLPRSAPSRGAAKALFGAGRIRTLEYFLHSNYPEKDLVTRLLQLHYQPPEASSSRSVYPENDQSKILDYTRDILIKESLRYGIPSTETAFVGVAHSAGEKVSASILVPNTLPAGWSGDFMAAGDGNQMAIMMQPDGTLMPRNQRKSVLFSGSMIWADAPPVPSRKPHVGGMQSIINEALKSDEISSAKGSPRKDMITRPSAKTRSSRAKEILRNRRYRTVTLLVSPDEETGSLILFDSSKNDVLKDAVYVCGISLGKEVYQCDENAIIQIRVRGLSVPKNEIKVFDLLSGEIYSLDIWLDLNSRIVIILKDPGRVPGGQEITVNLHYMAKGELVVA